MLISSCEKHDMFLLSGCDSSYTLHVAILIFERQTREDKRGFILSEMKFLMLAQTKESLQVLMFYFYGKIKKKI